MRSPLGPRFCVEAAKRSGGASPWLARRTVGFAVGCLSDQGRQAFLELLELEAEALRAAGRSAAGLAMVLTVDPDALPTNERPAAAARLRKLAHRLRLALAREEDLGARVADLLLDTLAERLEESGTRAMPSSQVGRHNDALREVLALNLLREPFAALATLPREAVFEQAMACVHDVERQTQHWGSLGAKRVLRELETLVAELREAIAGDAGRPLGLAPAAVPSRR